MSVQELTAPNGTKVSLNTGLYINNEFVAARSGEKITSIDPATEKDIVTVEAAGPEDVDIAVKAARAALNNPEWRDIDPAERARLMLKLADLMEADKHILTTLDTWDNGKPYTVAAGDVAESIAVIRYYAGYADKLHGQTIMLKGKLAYTLRQPVGVCGQIIPWNYPLDMLCWKVAPALACGNAIVLKPAEQTPVSALHFAALVQKVGFPAGVVNILNGYGRTAGNAIVTHLGIDKVAFTGSTATGKQIQKAASVNMKNITLETGGKSPLIVFDDCDLEQAVKWGHQGIMFNQGQVCCASSRIFVHESIHDRYVAALTEATKQSSVVGSPWDARTFQGPQVTRQQFDRVMGFIDSANREGATCALGGTANTSVGDGGKGYFVNPTIFTGVRPGMTIYREEVFGPLVAITPFGTEEEALAMANDTEYGLGSAVFSRDIERCHRVASRLEAGTVWINSSADTDIHVPFGGYKQSGIGRELGEAGLAAYSQIKSVHINMGNRL